MNKKRLLCICAVLMLILLAACGSDDKAEPEKIEPPERKLVYIEKNIAPVSYNEAYDTAKVYVIADGKKRMVKLDGKIDEIIKVVDASKIQNPQLCIKLYSGKSGECKENNLAAEFRIALNESTDLSAFTKGYDFLENATAAGKTAVEVNKKLQKNELMFAAVNLLFEKPEDERSLYATKNICSHSTVYTPVD